VEATFQLAWLGEPGRAGLADQEADGMPLVTAYST